MSSTASVRRRRFVGVATAAAAALGGLASASSAVATTPDGEAFEVDVDACNDPDAATAEITETWKVGYSAPLSGPVAGVVELALTGFKARIALANAEGGINGVSIEVIYRDDQFTPDRAKANVTEFLQSDHVDSVTTFGSGPVGAMADDQNAECVPLLYPSSSVQEFRNVEEYPWTVQFLPSNEAEARYDIALIQEHFPDGATVAIAENQTASGKGYSEAFQNQADGTNVEVILVTPSTDPNAAATQIKDANPDVVFNAGITTDCGPMVQALERVGFTPQLVVNPSNCADTAGYIAAGSAADGNLLPSYTKDPSAEDLQDDPAVQLYRENVTGETFANPVTVSGWLMADLLVNTLTQASNSPDGLTHVSVIQAARNQAYAAPMLREGVEWLSSPDELIGISGFQTLAWSAADQAFQPEGDIIHVAAS